MSALLIGKCLFIQLNHFVYSLQVWDANLLKAKDSFEEFFFFLNFSLCGFIFNSNDYHFQPFHVRLQFFLGENKKNISVF